MGKYFLMLASGAFAAASTVAHAQKVYKCVDATGTTVFSATPCGTDAKEIDTTAANRQSSGSSDAVRDISLSGDCKRRTDAVYAEYNGSISDVQQQIDRERDSMRYSNNNLAGATRDNAISQRIAALESRKTTLLEKERSSLHVADTECQMERDAEVRRRQQRDAIDADKRAKELAAKKAAADTAH